MKKLVLTSLMLAGLFSAQAQLDRTTIIEVGLTNERVAYWTTDQATTLVLTSAIGGLVGEFVESKTNSRFLGLLSGAVVGAGLGYAKDKWDHSDNTAIVNSIPVYNDTIAGAVGGAIGGFTIRFNIFEGGKRSKAGFMGRYRMKRRRKW